MNRESLISKEEYVFYEDKRIWSKYWKKFLDGYVNSKGYVIVILKCVDEKYRRFQWHRVIWYVFNGEIPNGMQVNHINEDKTDNRLCNLNLMTPKENTNWGTGIERRSAKQRNHPNESKPVVAVDKDDNVVYEFPSTAEAERNGFHSGHISACCNKRPNFNTHKGLYWFWKSEWLEMKNAAPHKRETA